MTGLDHDVAPGDAAMTILEEMTKVMLAKPGPHASDEEVAAWYQRKAQLFEHIAAGGGPDAEEARRQATLAHRHSLALRDGQAPQPTRADRTEPLRQEQEQRHDRQQ